jgi:PAS domain S-box-containing protein
MGHAIVVAGRDGRISHWDDGATELFGYPASEAIGQPVELIIPEEFHARHREGFARVMRGGERHLVGATINLPVRLQDGGVLAFPARFVHLDDAWGEPIGAMGIFTDRKGDEEPWTPVVVDLIRERDL